MPKPGGAAMVRATAAVVATDALFFGDLHLTGTTAKDSS